MEATERFFDAFGLDQPRVPLLMPEFSNPLFLKLYCEGLKGLGLKAPPTGETHASDVFDRYLKAKAERIASRLNLDPATRPVETAIDAFCKALARENRDSIERERSAEIINQFAPGRDQWPDTLLGQLLSEGVLTADLAWHRSAAGPVDVIRFTYQRFADYRVASALLESSKGDPQRLREALAAGSPLRKQVLERSSRLDRGPCCSNTRAIQHRAVGCCQLASRFVHPGRMEQGVREERRDSPTFCGDRADAEYFCHASHANLGN